MRINDKTFEVLKKICNSKIVSLRVLKKIYENCGSSPSTKVSNDLSNLRKKGIDIKRIKTKNDVYFYINQELVRI